MKTAELTVRSWLSTGWATFIANFGILSVGSFILLLSSFVLLIPIEYRLILCLIPLLITPILYVGFIGLCLKLIRREPNNIANLFDGFHVYWKAPLISIVLVLIIIVPIFISTMIYGFGYGNRFASDNSFISNMLNIQFAILIILAICSIPILISKYCLSLFVLADKKLSPFECFKSSSNIVRGNELKIFAVFCMFGLFAYAINFVQSIAVANNVQIMGIISLLIYSFILGPWMVMTLAVAYNALVEKKNELA